MMWIERVERAVRYAEHLASAGLPCFPCDQLKHPSVPRGFYAATTDLAVLRAMWLRYPGPLVGFPTGEESGLDVLDVDLGKHPEAALWWAENAPRLPATWSHRTISGGLHLVYRHRHGQRCSQSEIAVGIDIRAIGGYAIFWPAAGCRYWDADFADWPKWLVAPEPRSTSSVIIERRGVASPIGAGGLSAYGEAALAGAARAILGAPEGRQRDTLNKESFSIGTLAGAGGVPIELARHVLLWAARRMVSYRPGEPWTEQDIEDKVDTAFADGLQRPREVRGG